MNHLNKIISTLTLPVLASLSGQAEAATALANFDSLSDLFHFDARSLIWMLIGGAIVITGIFLRARSSGKDTLQAYKPEPHMPSGIKAASDGETSLKVSAGGETAHSMQYWMDLDEATTVTVEELSRIEEEAEVFLMMGRPDVAIKVLRDYLEAELDCKANVWFKLLDIYHVQGMREAFDDLAQEMKTRFNVALPTWEDSHTEAQSRYGLEHFPNLLAKISQHWNDPSGLEYLQGLMQDKRQGERTGFHEEAFRDMLLLFDVLEAKIDESLPRETEGEHPANAPEVK